MLQSSNIELSGVGDAFATFTSQNRRGTATFSCWRLPRSRLRLAIVLRLPQGLGALPYGSGDLAFRKTSNVSSITQKAVVAALTGSQAPVKAMLDEYRKRREHLYEWLTADPRVKCRKPGGAFYMFVDISEVLTAAGMATSTDFAEALLDEARVAVTPGEAFDAPGFLRISYATSIENLRDGSRRLLEFVAKRAPSKNLVSG